MIIAKRLIPGLLVYPRLNREGLREVFGYGVFSSITVVLSVLWRQADKIVLGSLIGPIAVTAVAIPQELIFRVLNMVSSLSAGLFPRFSSMNKEDEMQALYLNAVRVMMSLTIVMFVPMVALMPDILRLWIGPSVPEESVLIGRIIASGCILRGAFVPHSAVFQGLAKPHYLTGIAVAGAITNLSASLILIPCFGLRGAGYSWVVGIVWGFPAMWLAWYCALKGKRLRPLVSSIVPFSVLAACLLGGEAAVRCVWPVRGWISLIAQGAAFAGVCCVGVIGLDVVMCGRRSSVLNVLSRSVEGLMSKIRPPIGRSERDAVTR